MGYLLCKKLKNKRKGHGERLLGCISLLCKNNRQNDAKRKEERKWERECIETSFDIAKYADMNNLIIANKTEGYSRSSFTIRIYFAR